MYDNNRNNQTERQRYRGHKGNTIIQSKELNKVKKYIGMGNNHVDGVYYLLKTKSTSYNGYGYW